MGRALVFNYNSRFAAHIVQAIHAYNLLYPKRAFFVDMYRADECGCESEKLPADVIIHSGGDGRPVKEDVTDTSKIYICHSHQWKAKLSGGEVIRLKDPVTGIKDIDIIEDDDMLGKSGKMRIMEYHELAVVKPPSCARVIAVSKAQDAGGKEVEIIEALRYPDGSISVQGHPEEGRGFHVLSNFLNLCYGKSQITNSKSQTSANIQIQNSKYAVLNI